MKTKSFKELFKDSQNFEDLVEETIAMAGKVSYSGKFPIHTREEAEALVLGWSNQLEAVGTVLEPKRSLDK
jgi:hypothetical protein